MRVAANLAWLVPGRAGGSEEYTVRLLSAVLASAPADLELRILAAPELFAAHPGLQETDCVELPGPMARRPWRIAVESTVVHRATRDADVVHHFGGRVPARHHRERDVVTIHDLQPLAMPDNFSALKRRYLATALPRSARVAAMVATPSQFVAEDVVARLGADASSVWAVSSTWDDAEEIDPTLAESVGEGPVVLYPAVTHPHKRHELLLEAMTVLVETRDDVTLVLTGGQGRAEPAVRAAIATTSSQVVHHGRVSAPSLRGLYRRADVLAFPSDYEGFGLPVLEAMRAGLPVVAANRTAIPEVVGDTGVLLDTHDPAAWAGAIGDVLTGGPAVVERTERARARAEQWSPQRAADRLVEVWRSLM